MLVDSDIFDDMIRILECRRGQGCRYVNLAPGTRERFFRRVVPARPASAPPSVRRARSAVARAAVRRRTGPAPASAGGVGTAPAEQVQAAVDVSGLGWEALEQQVAGCRLCQLHAGRATTVFGEGAHDARLMFIGEGPGFEEDIQGRPFVGPAGLLLTRMIAAMQFAREEVYIANVLKCHPPGNRNPRAPEAGACLPYLNRQIDLVQPEVIVLLGAVPLFFLLGKTGIRQMHGRWHEYRGTAVLPTFHPARLLQSPEQKADAWRDLQQVMQRLGKDPSRTARPGRGSS